MYFTDFDASDKGRPASTAYDLDSGADDQDFLGVPFPSIEDLASSLDLDFEDDFGAPPEPAAAIMEPSDGAEDAPVHFRQDEEDYIPDSPPASPSELPFAPIPRAAPPPSRAEHDVEERNTADDMDAMDDILSFLSPLPAAADAEEERYRPFEGEWRGHRLGMPPPRSAPYGGVKRLREWYRPPEELAEGAPDPGFAADWYEPPRAAARPAAAPPPEQQATDTTNLDLFTDVDLDALWREKLREKRVTEQRRKFDDGTETRSVDLFDDMDIEALWEEKVRGARPSSGGSPDSPFAESAPGADGMVVPSADRRDVDSTVILSESGDLDRIVAAAFSPHPVERSHTRADIRPSKKKSGKKRKRPTRQVDPAAAMDFLDDLEHFFRDDDAKKEKTSSSPVAAPEPVEAAVAEEAEPDADEAARPSSADEFLDNLSLDELVPSINENVKPPVVGDDDIEPMEALSSSTDALGAVSDAGPTSSAALAKDDVPSPSASSAKTSDQPPAEPIGIDALLAREKTSRSGAVDGASAAPSVDDAAGAEEQPPEPDAVALNPLDVFSNMDDMDFSGDGLGDEAKALMEEEELDADDMDADGPDAIDAETVPADLRGKARFYARKLFWRVAPKKLVEKLCAMIAWRENWWFYCDLLAAVVSSASLAVIISYFLWYR